ncbi:MAG: thioredoxin family protein [Oscillospiraceae bacterium]|nr:thioredoxin family protein [Oscillospiraceae bacterium]
MIEVNKDNFEAEVLQAQGVVFVDFWSLKCEPCMALMPDVEAMAERYEGKAKFCKLDAGTNKRLSISQKVMGLPSFVFYKDGERVFTFDPETLEMGAVEAKLQELIG